MEELSNSIPSRNEDLINAKGGATNTDFIGSMHTGMLLCFNWKVFKYAVVSLLERIYKWCLIYVYMIYRNKMAREFNYMYGKT